MSSRSRFAGQLLNLEQSVQDMSAAAQDLFALSLSTIGGQDRSACRRVVSGDQRVDAYRRSIDAAIMDLFTLQSPIVASDLRLLTGLLHIDLHLERVGDLAVTIARTVEQAWGMPCTATVVERLQEMGQLALRMHAAAMDALARRDLELCRRLTAMDEPIDRLNRGMLSQIFAQDCDAELLQWGIRMHVVSREIERVGDHAVDIGEQVAYLITGRFAEFTDASHPEVEYPDRFPQAAAG